MGEEDRRRWDARWAAAGLPPAGRPQAPPQLAPHVDLLPRTGTALDLACGAGGGSTWLADRGLHVTAVDASPVAVDLARAAAEATGTADRITFRVADLDDGLPPGPPVDVVLCHLFRAPHLDAAIADRLAPGGVLALVALSEVGGRPGAHRAAPGELVAAFPALTPLVHGEGGGRAWLLARRDRPAAPPPAPPSGGRPQRAPRRGADRPG